MTTAQNNLVRRLGVIKTVSYPIKTDGTADINQGDLLDFDGSSYTVKPLASDSANFAGVAMDSSFINPYGTKEYRASMEVCIGAALFSFITVSGQTYHHLDPVYYSTDAQHVTAAAGSNTIGYVVLRDGQSAISGDGVKTVDILVAPLKPSTGVA